jgi:hypothetical protein
MRIIQSSRMLRGFFCAPVRLPARVRFRSARPARVVSYSRQASMISAAPWSFSRVTSSSMI